MNGWRFYHGGIKWRVQTETGRKDGDWAMHADFVLIVQPVESSRQTVSPWSCYHIFMLTCVILALAGISCYFKLGIRSDDVVLTKDNPFSKPNTSSLFFWAPGSDDRLSNEMVAVQLKDGALFLKAEPRYVSEDRGTYTVRITVSKYYKWKISPRTRFNFTLAGPSMRPDPLNPSQQCIANPWTDPVNSERVDIERTPEMAAEGSRLLRQ